LLEPLPPDAFYETTTIRSAADEATPPKFVNTIQSEDWRTLIVAAVRGYYEAEDGVTDKRVAIRARNYHIIDGNLYRKGVCAPLLKCISVTEGKQLLHESLSAEGFSPGFLLAFGGCKCTRHCVPVSRVSAPHALQQVRIK
jgi:hypothetical protein